MSWFKISLIATFFLLMIALEWRNQTMSGKFTRILWIKADNLTYSLAQTQYDFEFGNDPGLGAALRNSVKDNFNDENNVIKVGERFILDRVRVNWNGLQNPRANWPNSHITQVYFQVFTRTSDIAASDLIIVNMSRSEEWQEVGLFVELTDFSDPTGYVLKIANNPVLPDAVIRATIANLNVQPIYDQQEFTMQVLAEITTTSELQPYL